MKPSQNLIDFIARHEGFKAVAYKPLPTDRWTIGYGFTYIDGYEVLMGDVITKEDALKELLDEATKVGDRLHLPLNVIQQQFDAVVSLAYNIGVTAFNNSDTGALFKQGADISTKFPQWNRSGGLIITGLTARRLAEQKIYKEGKYT